MELSIQKWGNSAAVRLPTTLLEQLKVALGDKLSVDVRPDGVMLKPARHKYSLDELVAQCDPKAPTPRGLADWSGVKPVGREVW
ncbi:PemI-like protein (plasmid) [Cupriavidus necator N-1]|uniref:PemI-like protein n=1 Tax=Cupriavidus necator (strain ATCC 43291 / DSM 13513 / CCUG 52238 / LMG 8453 / N-1) TaxID=1042878 RepID=F8GXY4_CUPNN|nr:AbrB/MazE/SpoVT family DNA-binding domain-containing protein [Cupriavidus necator]AEI82204.1 PemI-like protein [Cupriavidus necator N-1]MDX6007228.1 AbrB/MazE/SpoVT family DNA-binding domain-containing protein [Cupriavidus necator]